MAYTDIDKPSDYFEAFAYTGNGNTKVNFASDFTPNMTWFKVRNNTYDHQIHDSVRGVNAGYLDSATSVVEQSSYPIASFDSDGVTTVSGNITGVNKTSDLMVSWNWKAGGSASSNSNGSITSSVSVNTTAGFSIVKYQGTGANATVGHGLGSVPKMIFFKSLTNAISWIVYSSELNISSSNCLRLNGTNAAFTESAWNDTRPTTSLFSLGSHNEANNNSGETIAYCFADVKGFSRMGSYTGNGNTNGSFVYTGFSPAWLMIKQVAASNDWFIIDNKREPFNPNNVQLVANTNGSASTNKGDLNLLSNGFKPLSTNAAWNENNAVYVYMAFAQNPFVTGSSAIPTTAR